MSIQVIYLYKEVWILSCDVYFELINLLYT